MNKTYKINNVEISADQIKEIIKNNPELLKENKGGKYFFPKEGENYWVVTVGGKIGIKLDYDNDCIVHGVYRTQKEAELARDKQKAIVACWKWAQENAPFEPDWDDEEQKRFYIYFNRYALKYLCTWEALTQTQFILPYFKSEEDCIAFIEANKEHLELLFKN